MVDYEKFKEDEDQRIMTSGLNRGNNSGPESSMKEIKYVITNPQKSIKLRADDLVFVLA